MLRAAVILAVLGWVLPAASNHAQQDDSKNGAESEAIVFTNADLPPPLPAGGTVSTPAPAPASPSVPSLPSSLPSYDGHRDKNGRGEGWWRQRAAALDVQVLEARRLAQELHVAWVRKKYIIDPTLPGRSGEATARLKQLEAEREKLPEELRQAGGFPGWLRRGGESLPSDLLPSPEPLEAAYGEALTLSWKSVQDARFYLVEVQCLDCCGPIGPCDVRTHDVTRTSLQIPFEVGRSGQWRVRALDAGGFGGKWTDWSGF